MPRKTKAKSNSKLNKNKSKDPEKVMIKEYSKNKKSMNKNNDTIQISDSLNNMTTDALSSKTSSRKAKLNNKKSNVKLNSKKPLEKSSKIKSQKNDLKNENLENNQTFAFPIRNLRKATLDKRSQLSLDGILNDEIVQIKKIKNESFQDFENKNCSRVKTRKNLNFKVEKKNEENLIEKVGDNIIIETKKFNYPMRFFKKDKESFLQRNIKFKISDLKNVYCKFLDKEKVHYNDEKNNQIVFPEYETTNSIFKDFSFVEQIFNRIVQFEGKTELNQTRMHLINEMINLIDNSKTHFERLRDKIVQDSNSESSNNFLQIDNKPRFTISNETKKILFDKYSSSDHSTAIKSIDKSNIQKSDSDKISPNFEQIQNSLINDKNIKETSSNCSKNQEVISTKCVTDEIIQSTLLSSYTFINCDVNYFNFEYLAKKIGSFDVIMMDPPWRIKGGQKNDSQFMFANNKFCLEYDTMSNDQIAMLNIKCLSEKGFIFLWILGNQINMACEMMNKWGYDLVDLIIWIKTKKGKIYLSHGYYLMHSYEICLVGYKCPAGQHVEYFSKVSNNVIFGEVTGKSQKPVEIYEIIEMMMPGSKKLEVFARNNNLRKGWFSIGNQLGEEFHQWTNKVDCDKCSKSINIGTKRYKSKKTSNFDLCENCLRKYGYDKLDFFEIQNEVADVVLHQYYSCNSCNMNPIWGLRFSCQDCPNIDLCEGCYDNQFKKNMSKNHFQHDLSHNFEIHEMQELSHGFQIHLSEKCASCYQKPITGVCFKCSSCQNLSLCQKCYFNDKGLNVLNRKSHKSEHNWEFFIKPVKKHVKKNCSWCEKEDSVRNYSCDICFDFGLCDNCYMKKNHFKVNKATTHKVYHNFTKIEE